MFWDGTSINLPPVFAWGSRIGAAPPNQRYPGWLNINRTQDYAVSLTKVTGRHTIKTGFYNNHSFKAQNTGAGGLANLSFQGYVNFGNDTNNPIDTRLRLRERRHGRVHAVPPGGEAHRRQHDLQQHRVLRSGQLEGEQPADHGLRDSLHPAAAAVRPVRPDVELLPGAVVGLSGAGALPGCVGEWRSQRLQPYYRSRSSRFPACRTRRRPSARRSPASGNPERRDQSGR